MIQRVPPMITDPFVRQVADLCRTEPVAAKWVIVPSHGIGRTLGERLALEGVDWVNLRFATPFSLALATAAPHLVEQGINPLADDLGPSLMMRLLMELPDGTPAHFRPLAEQPQMGAALWRAVQELRLAGIDAARLHERSTPKFQELSALLASYDAHLASQHQADAADVYRSAAAHAIVSSVDAGDLLIEAPGLGPQMPLVRAFLDALPARRVAAARPAIPQLSVPRRAQAHPSTVVSSDPADAPLRYLLAPSDAPHDQRPRISLSRAAGREAEVESVLRRIISAGIPLDQVEVVCAAADAAPIAWEKAQRYDIPVTLESGVPATVLRPARALLAFCDWIDSDFFAGRLRRLLQAGDLRLALPADPLSPAAAARLLLRSEATWGRDTYARSLAALAGRYRAEAAAEEADEEEREEATRKAGDTERFAAWINGLLSLIPTPGADGKVALSDLLDGVAVLTASHLPVAGPLDAGFVASIKTELDDLRALGAFRCTPRQGLAFIRAAVQRLSVGAARPRAGHLHLSTLGTAAYAARRFTFVIGLEEGGVFPALIEDPVLLDAEREQLDASLPTSHDRLQEAIHAAISRLALLPAPLDPRDGHITFSYSCRDLRDGRETGPSWLMLQALRLTTGNAALTYADLHDQLPAVPEALAPAAPEDALSDAGWWLASLPGAGTRGMDAVLKAFPRLQAGVIATDSRGSDDFTEFDGFVPAAAALLDPRRSDRSISVTRLERLVECPYRYFLEHALGVKALDEEPDEDEWLDAMQRGTLLHAIFARLSREARARGTALHPTHDHVRAREVADEELASLRDTCPPPNELVFEAERDAVHRDVALFLDFEAAREPSEPVAFELAFGHGGQDGEEPLAQAEPVAIPLGGGKRVLVRGTIDRVNRLPDGTYEVSDYKTGGYYAPKFKGTFACGGMLQHALYGLAAAKLLRRLEPKPLVVRGAYEFPSAKGGGERRVISAPSQAAVVEVLTDLFDVMATGAFLPARDKKACEWCDFTRACDKPTETAAEKLENDDNGMLEAYRRLLTHE